MSTPGKPLILDVRTHPEYAKAHAPDSLHVPLDHLPSGLPDLERDQAILVCCATGVRSAMAKQLLEGLGYRNVVNAGSWRRAMEMAEEGLDPA
jgi:phage shock protein E